MYFQQYQFGIINEFGAGMIVLKSFKNVFWDSKNCRHSSPEYMLVFPGKVVISDYK